MKKARKTLGRYSWYFCRISAQETLLPYEIYICTKECPAGSGKSIPYLYVLLRNKFVAVSIEDTPVVLCKRYKSIQNLQDVINWIKSNKIILLKHWNGNLSDKKTLSLLCEE